MGATVAIAVGPTPSHKIADNEVTLAAICHGLSTSNATGNAIALAINNIAVEWLITGDDNNNGVVTVLKDNGCELVDVFGHAVTGSVNGGLAATCGDLAVTVSTVGR